MKKKITMIIAGAFLLGACSDTAMQTATVQPANPDLAYDAIKAQDWDGAEATLASAEMGEDEVFRLLNLAYVYQQTGREAEAAAIYEQILSQDSNPVALLPSGDGRPVKRIAMKALKSMKDENNN